MIGYGIYTENIRNLACVKFGIWFIAHIGGSFRAAFVKTDFTILPTPAFWKHAVCGEFRAGGKTWLITASIACKGDLAKYAVEFVVIQIEFVKCPIESLFCYSITFIE